MAQSEEVRSRASKLQRVRLLHPANAAHMMVLCRHRRTRALLRKSAQDLPSARPSQVPALRSVHSRLDGRRDDGERLAIGIVRREESQKAAVEAVCTGKLTGGWYTNQKARKRASIMSGDLGFGGAGHQASLATVSSRR